MLYKFFEILRASILFRQLLCFFFVEQTRLVLNDLKYFVIGHFLQLCVEHFLIIFSFRDRICIVGPKYFIGNYSPKECFSFTTHSLYSLDIRGGVELGLSFPLQWHYSYRQLVKKFLANTNKLSIRKAQAGILQRVPHSASQW